MYLVRNPDVREQRASAEEAIRQAVKRICTPDPQDAAADLHRALIELQGTDAPHHMGALKLYEIPNGGEGKKAMGRLAQEVKALSSFSEPALLRLLKADLDKQFIITEYHTRGTLATLIEQPSSPYKGNVRAGLAALRSVVTGVAHLHAEGLIHRDCKPENIFVAADGRLVLGDFGIVIFRDAAGERLTETFDRPKGTRDWMAPWAYTGKRISVDETDGTFDVFPLGKILWCMLSGDRILPLWYYERPENNLERRFPDDPDMRIANEVLSHCVVENREDCLPDANKLLSLFDRALTQLHLSGQRLRLGQPHFCRNCGKGVYRPEEPPLRLDLSGRPVQAKLFVCDGCGHLQAFLAQGEKLVGGAWAIPKQS